jgi:rare lipoprotein A (peptidoglycan hydrolase)
MWHIKPILYLTAKGFVLRSFVRHVSSHKSTAKAENLNNERTNFLRIGIKLQNVKTLLIQASRFKTIHAFNFATLTSYLFIFFLTSCSTHRYTIKGLTRSSKAYQVNGHWYFPQKFYNYDEVGLASWYGPGFHGSKKAQGEIYNQNAMSAAHKTLPLPTIVKVTNMANNKSVILLVDDRGPFKNKRIVDLSAAAAKELDLYNKGVGKVRVRALLKESCAFSAYLKKYGTQSRLGKQKRTWDEVYRQEIGCRPGFYDLTAVPRVKKVR